MISFSLHFGWSSAEILGGDCFVKYHRDIFKNIVKERLALTKSCYHFLSVRATKNQQVCPKDFALRNCHDANITMHVLAVSVCYFMTAKQAFTAFLAIAVENEHLDICLFRKYKVQLLRESLHTRALLCQINNTLSKKKE